MTILYSTGIKYRGVIYASRSLGAVLSNFENSSVFRANNAEIPKSSQSFTELRPGPGVRQRVLAVYHSGTSILKYLHSNLFISIVYCTNVKTTTKPWSAFCPASAPAAPLRAAPRAHQLRARAAPAPHGGGTPPPSQVIWAPWHVQDGPGPRSEWVARSTSGSRRSEPCPALSPTAPSVRSQLL